MPDPICVVDQEKLIAQITDRVGLLVNTIPNWAKPKLAKISEKWDMGVVEIAEHGKVTAETCLSMSRLLITAEEDAKRRAEKGFDRQTDNWRMGLFGIHDNMTWLAPGNEGPKPCCPYCADDC